jgi:tRNA threonylcarbamoyl adenosine modification protein (Sua5/YciO/YrdC/YwlC family)
VTQRIVCADAMHRDRAVAAALAAVRRGDLVIIPTESVYAVATDAFSRRGVVALREAKGYDSQVPLPVMVGSRSTVPGIAARLPDDARALMDAFWPGPLTLLLTPQATLAWDLPVDAPLAVRMPLHPLALALLAAAGPLIVTSANLPGLPAPTDVDDALGQLGDDVALALDAGPLGDPDAPPSTVVDVTGHVPRVVRVGEIAVDRLRAVCPHVVGGDRDVTQ